MMRPGFVFLATICAAVCSSFCAPAAAGYAVLDAAHAFRGRIMYVAHRTDALPSPEIAGTLTIGDSFWLVEERSPSAIATANGKGGSLQGGGFSTSVDDPLASGAIANAWAVAMGTLSTYAGTRAAGGDAVWQSAALRLYLSEERDSVLGLADGARAENVSFAFDKWVDVAGVRLPQSVMRLRRGVPEASYSIEGFTVLRSATIAAASALPRATQLPETSGSTGNVALQTPIELQRIGFPWRLLSLLFGLLLLAVSIVAWTRRETLLEELRARVQADPRGWQSRGVSLFVSPDGRLWFDGSEYVVGPQFYSRQAVVQSSPLFLRIGAREVPRAVIVARKFRIPALRAVKIERARSRGLSLIENIVAMSVFAAVVVGAVYPTLVVMANGDRIARTQADAVRLATNALSDEETASAYSIVSDGTVQNQVGALTVVVTVGPSQTGVAEAHDIDVSVRDATGRSLAHAISTVGPAVPAPPPPGHTPNPSPAPTG
jgi:hypothetical protein